MNRLHQQYQETIVPQLQKELGYENALAVPRLTKVVLNMGIGDVAKDKTLRAKVMSYLGMIAGQKPQFCPAKKSIAEFNTRAGDPVGVRVTLRGRRAYEFVDKLCSIALPRVRDFQGVKATAFDERGSYNLGLREQIIFPEIEYDTIDRIRGLQITICTTGKNKKETYLLLKALGMPFEKKENK